MSFPGRRHIEKSPVSAAAVLASVAAAVLLALIGGCGSGGTASTPHEVAPGASGLPVSAASFVPTPTPAAPGPGTIAFTGGAVSGADNLIQTLGIYLVRADGSGLRRLTDSGCHPAWSPDGSKIAYSEWMDGIWIMNADGSGRRRVAPAMHSVGLAWSPDGAQLVFSTSAGVDVAVLNVVNADGSGGRQLTTAGKAVAYDENSVWAPNGKIYFTRWRQKPVEELADGSLVPAEGDVPRFEICAVDPDGSGLTVVKRSAAPTNFSLSPDGRWLVVYDRTSRHMVRVAADGSGKEVELFNRAQRRSFPALLSAAAWSWSPDGKTIVFAANEASWVAPTALYLMDADGSGLRTIPHVQGWNPVWRPE